MLNSHKIRSTASLRAFVASVTVLLVSVLFVTPALTQDTPGEDEIRNPEAEEASLPIIFRTGFSQQHLASNIWAYDIRSAAVVREDPEARGEEANLVLQLGHEEDWSSIVFERGADWRNYIVEVDVKLLNEVEDADNFFLGVRYDRNIGEYALSLNAAAQSARLSSTIDGLWVGSLHQEPLTLHIDTWYRLKAHVEGGLIRFYVDDRFIGFIDDVEITRGSIRMLTPPDSFVQVDNLIVREIQSSPEPDDLLITEFMFREDGLQWFEILNDSDRHIKLDGMTISNGSETYVVSRTSLVMPPGSYKVFASENTTPYFTLDSQPYIYGDSLRFPADDGYLGLSVNDQVVTEIEYSEDTGWPLQDNVSVALHPDYLSRRRQNNGFNWCPSVQRLSDEDSAVIRATPGEINHLCVRELPVHNHGGRQSGELVITEIMIDLPGPDQGREWFEVYNTTDTAFSMTGLTIATDSPTEKHTITDDFSIPPHSYAVLAQAGLSTSELPDDIAVYYYYSGYLNFRNSQGELTLLDGDRVIDSVTWRDNGWWPIGSGMSMSLHPEALSAYSNDDALNWCLAWSPIDGTDELLGTPGAPNDLCPMWEINSPLVDTVRAYEDARLEPITIHISVNPGDLVAMNANPFSDREYPAHFSTEGYETGEDNNATMRPRGGTFTRAAEIKSYRIRLDEPFWEHRTLHLNKHLGDPSRLRNALSFRLFQEMNDMVSLRTQFVHLFVNGEDFGLYTMVEPRSAPMLRNHRLDDRGHLFNIESGFFHHSQQDRARRNDSIVRVAELQVGLNHDGLIEMMDAVYSDEDIFEVIDRHFNLENLLTYFASVYLLQNPDSRAKNYLLYSTPREPARVYFLPWDWDLAFFPHEDRAFFVGSWREGFGNWAGIGIFDRMLQEPELVDALIFKMVELAQTSLSQERINILVDQLAAQVEPFTRRMPERNVMTPDSLAAEAEVVKGVVAASARDLIHLIERPQPFPVDTVVYDTHNNAVTFTWHETFSLQDAPLSYEVVLFSGSQWDESHTVWRSPRTTDTSLTVTADDLPDDVSAGPYYWLVYVWDDNGNYNTSYNMDSFGAIYDLVNLP